ncbi:MAG TPA: tetratricopeptide repeat protein [Planctomycetota bacterium]|nr:tetratricopeptide repeat protein [Planctomycetota bacterium]
MRRAPALLAGLACVLAGRAILGDEPGARVVPGDRSPRVTVGRRDVPSDDDPWFLHDVDVDRLAERLAAVEGASPEERIKAEYSLLLHELHAIAALEDERERRALYLRAEELYLAVLSEKAHARLDEARLESNAHFAIAAAWLAARGSLDELAALRLRRCTALKAGNYRGAAELLLEKTPVAPDDLGAAVARILDGDPAAALPRLDAAPRSERTLYWRGVALEKLQRHEEAIAAFTECLAIDANDAAALEGRAAARCARHDLRGALEDWKALFVIAPEAEGRLGPWRDAAQKATR